MAEHNDKNTHQGDEDIKGILGELLAIRADMVAEVVRNRSRLDKVHPNYRESARNLLHYLALRRRDLRPLQLRLAAVGLSSLGRAESHVLATVDAVLAVLHRLLQRSWRPPSQEAAVTDFTEGQRCWPSTEALVGRRLPDAGSAS
jgi:pyruvate kinase